ncbi:hypothetical protein phiLo_117 [Thermus phage phiLo]|nr:hypothetical protein phiLo_117 [Thermus phage phiLo]
MVIQVGTISPASSLPSFFSLNYSTDASLVTPGRGEVLTISLAQPLRVSPKEPTPPSISSRTVTPSGLEYSVVRNFTFVQLLSFFDSLVSDLPAIPTNYDGNYSFSSVPGAYHMIGGILENPDNEQRYLFFCVKRASSSFVLISPPYPIKEVIQMTSRYANMWIGNPGTLLSQGQMPTQYCHLATMEEGSGVAGLSEFKNLTIQVFHDWVAFSGEVGGEEEANLLIEIKRIPEMTVVKTLSGTTTGRRFYLDTHLPPGEYTYEAYAYASSSGSTGGGGDLSGGSGTGEGGSSSDSGDSE